MEDAVDRHMVLDPPVEQDNVEALQHPIIEIHTESYEIK